jgi:hypothetical protein
MAVFLCRATRPRPARSALHDLAERQITDSSVRAMLLSISGQANAIGQSAGGPVLGVIGTSSGFQLRS